MGEQAVRILQISDMHLCADHDATLLGVKTQESFEAIIAMLKKEHLPVDLILLTGDVSQDHSEAAYRRVAEMISTFQVPVYVIPGNHDDPALMARIFPLPPISTERHLVLKSWQIILLNTHKPKHVGGHLDASQLAFLTHCLEAYPEHDAMVVFHHHAVPVGSAWIDKLGVDNADEFWKLVKRFPKLKVLMMGHVHQVHEEIHQGVSCFTTPSTCIQFKRNHDKFAIENLPPGCRFMTLYDNAFFETGVLRLSHYIGEFDENATGY